MELINRIVVSPMCQYSAEQRHTQRLAPGPSGQSSSSAAPGLVITEMTDVLP